MFGMWEKSWGGPWKELRELAGEEAGAVVIETAVIIPMIWMMIMGSIFLLFFFFDMGVVRSQTIRIAEKTAKEWRDPDHKTLADYENMLREDLDRRLILADSGEETEKISFGRVTVRTKISFLLGDKGLTFSARAGAATDTRENWIRIISGGESHK